MIQKISESYATSDDLLRYIAANLSIQKPTLIFDKFLGVLGSSAIALLRLYCRVCQ